jgi:hypothetical protein
VLFGGIVGAKGAVNIFDALSSPSDSFSVCGRCKGAQLKTLW